MVAMKCIDFVKTAPMANKILGIVSFVCLLTGTFGYFIMFCKHAEALSDLRKTYDAYFQDGCSSDKNCRTMQGLNGTTVFLAILTFLLWLVWLIFYNFDLLSAFITFIYYGSVASTVILLIFNIAVMAHWEITGIWNNGDDVAMFIITCIGLICSLVLKFFFGGDSSAGEAPAEA